MTRKEYGIDHKWYIYQNGEDYYGIVSYKTISGTLWFIASCNPDEDGEFPLISSKSLSINDEFVEFDIENIQLFATVELAEQKLKSIVKCDTGHVCTCDIMVLMRSGCQCKN